MICSSASGGESLSAIGRIDEGHHSIFAPREVLATVRDDLPDTKPLGPLRAFHMAFPPFQIE